MKRAEAFLARLCRYPLKGFAGQDLSAADLRSGEGIGFDRHLAVVSGNRPEMPAPGSWVPSRTFVQNTVFDGLLHMTCRFDEDRELLQLERPDGDRISLRLGDAASLAAANGSIADWFANGPHGEIRLVEQRRGHGFWDFTDSVLSILNLGSIRALEDRAGRPLDPRRFRGNLHIDGLAPWEEFSWIGGTLRIGGATLRIIRPIQRCAATSVDPVRGERDFNLPGLLQQSFGHGFCGVYAQVIAGGPIALGDRLDIDLSSGGALPPQPENAPSRNIWPRIESGSMQPEAASRLAFLNRPDFLEATGDATGTKMRVHNLTLPGRSWAGFTLQSASVAGQAGWSLTAPEDDVGANLAALIDGGVPLLVTGPY